MLAGERQVQLTKLEEALSYSFNRLELLNQALTHKSFVHEQHPELEHNERLEFLGDVVLGLVISDYCFMKFADRAEGELSKLRAALVNEGHLAKIARRLELGTYLLVGRGEEHTGGRDKPSLLADTLEAVIAAIYLDSSLADVYRVVIRAFQAELQSVLHDAYTDYKSELQEFTQEKFGCIPSYTVVREYGPDHEKMFEVALSIGRRLQGMGAGKSKKEAEQAAARQVLAYLTECRSMGQRVKESTATEQLPCPPSPLSSPPMGEREG